MIWSIVKPDPEAGGLTKVEGQVWGGPLVTMTCKTPELAEQLKQFITDNVVSAGVQSSHMGGGR